MVIAVGVARLLKLISQPCVFLCRKHLACFLTFSVNCTGNCTGVLRRLILHAINVSAEFTATILISESRLVDCRCDITETGEHGSVLRVKSVAETIGNAVELASDLLSIKALLQLRTCQRAVCRYAVAKAAAIPAVISIGRLSLACGTTMAINIP